MSTWQGQTTFEVSSADPDDTPVWVDLSAFLRPTWQAIELNTGRQSELDQSDPSQLTLMLDNSGDEFTYGNLSSPYAAWWGPGRRCRLRETLGGHTLDLFTGYLEMPTEVVMSEGLNQSVSISAIDRLGRLEKTQTFISTLAAHIIHAGGTTLRRYWPCFDATESQANVLASDGGPKIIKIIDGASSNIVVTAGAYEIQPNGSSAVLADDVSPIRLTAQTGDFGGLVTVASPNDMRVDSLGSSIAIPAGQIITVVGWYYPELPQSKLATVMLSPTATNANFDLRAVDTSGTLQLNLTGTLSASITGRILPDQAWVPMAIRYGWDTALIQLWIGRDVYTGTLSGAPAGPEFLFGGMTVGTFYAGGFAHVQVYVGAAADWGYTEYIAQYEMAQFGLERQTTGERIRTLARYADIPESELGHIDTGTSVMSRALLAGKNAAAGMREAEQTEQGLLYNDGPGNLVFKDRRTLYNI